MRVFQSHKRVRAGKITAVKVLAQISTAPPGSVIEIEGSEPILVDAAWIERFRPLVGGYLIQYDDGYSSFSPAGPFEAGYTLVADPGEPCIAQAPVTGLSMGDALRWLNAGCKVRRAGWNGKGMWIVLMPGLKLPPFSSQEPGAKVNDRTACHIGVDTPLDSQPYIAMWTAQGLWQPGWLCSQNDLLATDWELVPELSQDPPKN